MRGRASAPQDLSWEEFRAQVYQEPDTGIFIVNGDEPVLNEERLREFYDHIIEERASTSAEQQEDIAEAEQPLTVLNIPGWANSWSSPEALNRSPPMTRLPSCTIRAAMARTPAI